MRMLWTCVKLAMVALVVLLMIGYFSEHVREAGGCSLATRWSDA